MYPREKNDKSGLSGCQLASLQEDWKHIRYLLCLHPFPLSNRRNGAPVALDKADTFTGAKSRFTGKTYTWMIEARFKRSEWRIQEKCGKDESTRGAEKDIKRHSTSK
ncbi:hypothetical protein C370_03847 [Cryptococcus neoformans A1-35-8]|nr:hypothetical protein C370_03847 [Cryptococcus neoformans var. grubii A1-35-8]